MLNTLEYRFIDQFIFPGGYLPSTIQLLNNISTQSHGSLVLERLENIGGHYVKTLRMWRENFLLNFDDKIRPSLLDSHPEISAHAILSSWHAGPENLFL